MAVPPSVEKLVLIKVDGADQNYDMSILLHRVEGAKWIVADADGIITMDNLANEEVIPLVSGQDYPMEGRPVLIRDVLDEGFLRVLRTQGRAMAEVHGAPVVADPGATTGAAWVYADPSHRLFGQAVASQILADPANMKVEGSCGILKEDFTIGGLPRWTFIEHVLENDTVNWKAEKRQGAGRDDRLSSLAATPYGQRPLFRLAQEHFSSEAPPQADLFDGPSSISELCRTIASSGMEPAPFLENFMSLSGVNPKGGLATELRCNIFTINLLATVDRLNVTHLASAEHIARRTLQMMRAVKRNPKSPDFDGLDTYLRRLDLPSAGARTPHFDRFVMEDQKTEAFIQKANRIRKEEMESENKSQAAGKRKKDNKKEE